MKFGPEPTQFGGVLHRIRPCPRHRFDERVQFFGLRDEQLEEHFRLCPVGVVSGRVASGDLGQFSARTAFDE
ncbi:hypothetical protein K8O92_30610 [Nocardia asteroides]|nr:hypothetical protein K8O92_30610 [Nocardia asteroides]